MPDRAQPILDVFILSYNRADYLRETLDCFFNQSWQHFNLTVLDNCSSDHTEQVVEEAARIRPVRFIRNPRNIGVQANFFQIQSLHRARWVMAFHDDDLLHPCYLEHAFRLLDQQQDCTMVSCNYSGQTSPAATAFDASSIPDYRLFKNQAHFASFCYTLNQVCFAACIYRSDLFNQLRSNFLQPFGKMWDRPVMIEAQGDGSSIVLKPDLVFYRLHPGQDSQSADSGPFLPQAIALTRYYRQKMGDDLGTSSGRSFVINNRAYLKGLYKWCSDRSQRSFNRFVAQARTADAATPFVWIPRPLMRMVKKILLRRDPDFF